MSIVAGPSYNLIIGQINLEYEKHYGASSKRSVHKQKWQHKQPLIMPDDHKHYSRYSADTKNIVEKIRRTLRQNLFAKGTLANLFERVNEKEGDGGAAAKVRDQDARMQVANKRKGGYSQFYQEEKIGASAAYQANNGRANMNQAQQQQDLDPSQFLIERQEFLDQLSDRQLATVDDLVVLTDVLFENTNDICLQQLEDFALGF